MAIKILAQIEIQIDERFSRTETVTVLLDDETLLQIANALMSIGISGAIETTPNKASTGLAGTAAREGESSEPANQ